jgi:hypothetical protein
VKYFISLFIVLLPFAFFYEFLEARLGDSWWSVFVFCMVLFFVRALIYFYRKSKGIPDDFCE